MEGDSRTMETQIKVFVWKEESVLRSFEFITVHLIKISLKHEMTVENFIYIKIKV